MNTDKNKSMKHTTLHLYAASPRISDPLPDSGAAWKMPELLSKPGVSFPLTPALSLGERENHPPRCDKSQRQNVPSDGHRGTLSLGERAGVRGDWAHVASTGSGCLSQAFQGGGKWERGTSQTNHPIKIGTNKRKAHTCK